jgi:hypothetical protein
MQTPHLDTFLIVMAGLAPAIHVWRHIEKKTWMRGTSPRMTA